MAVKANEANRAYTHTHRYRYLCLLNIPICNCPHCKCYWHRLSLSRLANLSALCQLRQSVQLKEGHNKKKRRVARRSSPLPLSQPHCSRLLQFKAQFNKHLCVQINYSTWRRVRCALSESGTILLCQCFVCGFVFVTKLLTNNNRQRNVYLARSLSLFLFVFLSLSVCVCAKQTTSAKFELGAKSLSVLSILNWACIHIYE